MSEDKPRSFLAAAQQVLENANEPLHYREITRRALEHRLVKTSGLTPEATMNAQIVTSLHRQGSESPFVRVAPGIFGLRAFAGEGLKGEGDEEGRIYVPHFPDYDSTRALMPAWEGLSRGEIAAMRSAVWEHRGTPQATADWTDPDQWIAERLEGRAQQVARLTWEQTKGLVNPRHTTGHWRLINRYRLLADDEGGALRITERGRNFIAEQQGEAVREIDLSEGLLKILQLVAELGRATRADLLPAWRSHVEEDSRVRSDSFVKSLLWARLGNLLKRGFVERDGQVYSLTQSGFAYLQEAGPATVSGEPDLPQQIRQLLDEQRRKVREGLRGLLAEIDPYAFEHLVQRLLDEMGYQDVAVTQPSRDQGVDVVGQIELGISSVREVVQVKRKRGNIQRQVLDQLRGVLHRFRAVRGTIITTGNFSAGTREAAFETGAAPVTLIDGEKLLDLLIQYDLGVQKRKLELWELDPAALLGVGAAEDEEKE